jgi:hypothetical protein
VNEAVRSALFRMAGAITRDMAVHHARHAFERGATRDQLDAAWAEWDAREAESVQVISCDPLCACAHERSWHSERSGRCARPACGCGSMRPGGRKTA